MKNKCNQKTNLKNGWNYCSFIKYLGFKNDVVFGVYLGCPCKKHDIRYSNEGMVSRMVADYLFFKDVQKEFKINNKKYLGFLVSFIMWAGVRIGGIFVWKTWSSKWAQRYK